MKRATPSPRKTLKRKASSTRSVLAPLVIVTGVLVLAGAGYFYFNSRGRDTGEVSNWIQAPSLPPPSAAPASTPTAPAPSASIAEGLGALSREAAAEDAPGAGALADAARRAALLDPATQAEPLDQLARGSSAALAAAIARETSERTDRVAKIADWAEPGRPAPGASAQQRTMALALHRAQAAVITAAANARRASDPLRAIAEARAAVAAYQRFGSAYARAYTMARARPAPPPAAVTAPQAPLPAPAVSTIPLSRAGLAARVAEMKGVHDSAQAVARQVVAMGREAKPRGSDGDKAQTDYRMRRDNAARARDYSRHLDALARSLRGAKTEAAAQSIVAQARTVRGYLDTLYTRSAAAMPPRR